MRFALPQVLWALFALPLVVALLWWSSRRRMKALQRYASTKLLPVVAPGYDSPRHLLRPLLTVLAATTLIFAAARPQWGYEDRKILSRGIDVMVAIDVSNSMLAQDYKPDRLGRAKQLLQDIIWRAKGDRIGVIAFAGNAFVQCPLTLDYRMAGAALQALGPNSVSNQGTNIGAALDAAYGAFESAAAGERILVLLTDGENQGDKSAMEASMERVAKSKVRVYTIGIGTTQGMPIPVEGGYKTDRAGKVVNSKLDFDTLTRIARKTGGRAIKANPNGSAELNSIMQDIAGLQRADHQDRMYRVYKERYQWFLLPAILLLVWEALETGYGRRRRRTEVPA